VNQDRTIDVGYGAVAVACASLLVYALTLRNGFAFDDVVLIPSDPRVTGIRIGALIGRPYWNDTALALYRPLTSVSFALDWALSAGAAAWFHFTNTMWHALASVLAYLLLARWFRPPAALAGGLLFALHPVHVEAVANIVGRGELIAAAFFIAACLIWTRDDLSAYARAVLTALCYVLAMFAKESAIVLPAVLFVLDGGRNTRRRLPEYAVLSATVVAYLLIRWSVVGGMQPARLDPSIEMTSSVTERIITAFQAWPVEARLLVFPRTLLADYGPRILLPLTVWTPKAAIGLTLFVATLVGGVFALIRGQRIAALALLWFPITILPVSNLLIPIGVLVAERTLYLPSFALCVGVAALFETAPRKIAIGVAVAVAFAFAYRVTTRIPDWKSTDTIMIALVRDRPDAFRGRWHLARMARARGDVAQALNGYARALEVWPYREGLVNEAAAYASANNRTVWARDVARWGTQHWPDNANLQRTLAVSAIDLGDTLTARRAVGKGLSVAPNDSLLIQMSRAFGSIQ
jgi:protein O-mannosyl-transferase